jgi:Domain of unknown function (DUF5625)
MIGKSYCKRPARPLLNSNQPTKIINEVSGEGRATKSIRLFLSLVAVGWVAGILPVFAADPTPPVSFPGKPECEGSFIYQISVTQYRSYILGLKFDYVRQDDLWRTFNLLGDGSRKTPGIALPVHLTITRLDTSADGHQVYDGNIVTANWSAHGGTDLDHGYWERKIAWINLESGIYRFDLSVPRVEAFLQRSCNPDVGTHPYLRFLKTAIDTRDY